MYRVLWCIRYFDASGTLPHTPVLFMTSLIQTAGHRLAVLATILPTLMCPFLTNMDSLHHYEHQSWPGQYRLDICTSCMSVIGRLSICTSCMLVIGRLSICTSCMSVIGRLSMIGRLSICTSCMLVFGRLDICTSHMLIISRFVKAKLDNFRILKTCWVQGLHQVSEDSTAVGVTGTALAVKGQHCCMGSGGVIMIQGPAHLLASLLAF